MTGQKTCAFLTLENREGFFLNDHLTFDPMAKLGWKVCEIPWDRQGVNWSEFDLIVVRSTWDYQSKPDQFLKVLAEIESSDARLLNPLSICRWNLDKVYLRELEQQGITIVPTMWLSGLNCDVLVSAFEEFESCGVVVKPTIGANADDTFALQRSEPDTWDEALKTFSNRSLMLQPFIKSIVEEGEYSLFYFGGNYSHAILKTPKQNDFRVQEEHGGTIQTVEISRAFGEMGQKIVDSLPEVLLYARVDLVKLPNGQPALIELELIEPSLYFDCDEQSPTRFANALDQMARSNRILSRLIFR